MIIRSPARSSRSDRVGWATFAWNHTLIWCRHLCRWSDGRWWVQVHQCLHTAMTRLNWFWAASTAACRISLVSASSCVQKRWSIVFPVDDRTSSGLSHPPAITNFWCSGRLSACNRSYCIRNWMRFVLFSIKLVKFCHEVGSWTFRESMMRRIFLPLFVRQAWVIL